VFLWLAFSSLELLRGQVVGKLWMTVLAVAVLAVLRRAVPELAPSEA
jgi:queuosine precursor transporter